MRYVLGFDGGGTKTECALMDELGRVRATGRSGPSNPMRVGFGGALAAVIIPWAVYVLGKSAIAGAFS